jgi:hypothetical protein
MLHNHTHFFIHAEGINSADRLKIIELFIFQYFSRFHRFEKWEINEVSNAILTEVTDSVIYKGKTYIVSAHFY